MGTNTVDSTTAIPTSALEIWVMDFFGSFFGIEAFFFHQALDVFYHHDGVIHQQADSQHHGKHGQHVDTKTEGIEHSKGTQQHYRYGNGWYQRRTPVLQE